MFCYFFFFKQKTAYEMRISDWSSDVCSSDLGCRIIENRRRRSGLSGTGRKCADCAAPQRACHQPSFERPVCGIFGRNDLRTRYHQCRRRRPSCLWPAVRSEEDTSELQSLMRTSYAVFCLQKKKTQ